MVISDQQSARKNQRVIVIGAGLPTPPKRQTEGLHLFSSHAPQTVIGAGRSMSPDPPDPAETGDRRSITFFLAFSPNVSMSETRQILAGFV